MSQSQQQSVRHHHQQHNHNHQNNHNHNHSHNHHHNHNSQNNSNHSSSSSNTKHSSHKHKHKSSKHSYSHSVSSTRVYARGYNYHYQFGLGPDNNDNYTTDLIELKWCRNLGICYICSGITHLCYLSFNGNYYFTGQIDKQKLGIISSDNNNSNNVVTHSLPTSSDTSTIRVQRIADGISSRHIIIISSSYSAYSMGNNSSGQLGLGNYKSTLSFNRILYKSNQRDIFDNITLDIIDASCGESHSAFVGMPRCLTLKYISEILRYYYYKYNLIHAINTISRIISLISLYIYRDGQPRGRLYVTGCNNYGQLGLGSSIKESINIFQYVSDKSLLDISIAQVSCGENHTICLDNRGRVYAFGDNYYGQSGSHLNHYENVYYPTRITYFRTEYKTRIVKISSGKYHCSALDKEGRVYCWGLGAYGQLGCNKLNKRIINPLLVDTLLNKKIIDIRCGIYHTCSLTNKGKLYCWGSNNYGQCFQNPNQENIITPKLANINNSLNGATIYKVFCGYYSTIIITQQ